MLDEVITLQSEEVSRLPLAKQQHFAALTSVLIVYTSGTTGKPKGAVHTQAGLLWNIVNATLCQDLTSRDHVLTVLPMFHVGGLCIQTLPALHAGATVTIHPRFDASAFLRDVAARRPTLLPGYEISYQSTMKDTAQ